MGRRVSAVGMAAVVVSLCAATTAHAEKWVAAWGTPIQSNHPFGYNLDPATVTVLPGGAALNQTIRTIVRPTLDGRQLRLRLSNAFGEQRLDLDHVTVGARGDRAAIKGPLRTVTFGGRPDAHVDAGGQLVSDPVDLAVAANRDLAVSVHIPMANRISWHSTAFVTSYAAFGDLTGTTSDTYAFSEHTGGFILDEVDVLTGDDATAVVTFGDSLTDGAGSDIDGHNSWPEFLARRFAASGRRVGVVKKGINGNNIGDGGIITDGPSGLLRMDRDVFSVAGVSAVFISEGSNDLSNNHSAQQVQDDLTTFALRVRARGLRVVTGTSTPRTDQRWNDDMEVQRNLLNAWLRAKPQVFDDVADVETAIGVPGRMDPRYDSGDHLHPNPAGQQRIADTVPLDALVPAPAKARKKHKAKKRRRRK